MRRNPDDDPFDEIHGRLDEVLNELTGGDSAPVDVHEYDDRITVVVDVPGVEEEDVGIRCDGRTLAIHASTGTGPYLERVDLPAYVDGQSASASYNNGVLEVTLDRTTDPANIGFY